MSAAPAARRASRLRRRAATRSTSAATAAAPPRSTSPRRRRASAGAASWGCSSARRRSSRPRPSDPFLLVDSTLAVCGMSALAEELLGVAETAAVNRHINELLVPADAEASGPGDLVNLLVHAARGDGEVHDVVLRPSGRVRHPLLGPRSGRAGPPRAALMVLGDGSSIRAGPLRTGPSAPAGGLLPLQRDRARVQRSLPTLRAARESPIHGAWARSARTRRRRCSA